MNKIKEARKAAGLTQAKMSELLGIPRRTIEDWDAEKSKPAPWAERLVIKELQRIQSEKEAENN